MSSRRGLERLPRVAKARTGTDDVERRATRAGVLARRRDELASLDSRNRGRQLPLERRNVFAGEERADDRVRPLEEVVDDLHLRRAAPEARERVHEALQSVLGVDDLLGRVLLERVRLV